jgi:alpha-galactosidase
MEFSAKGLPTGLQLDAKTGEITGSLTKPGQTVVTLRAKNAKGASEKKFRVVVGDEIALTPPMGWNSWNCWGGRVDAEKVLRSARGMVNSGLINHGWTYINIDDAWQGKRGGEFNGIQGNQKFPDMKGLCDEIHKMGLKAGIYSTPWTTSYAQYIGGSAENPEGTWAKPTVSKKGIVNKKILPWAIGKYSFARNDANQWAAWGIDYLKYDWNPNEEPETAEMAKALRDSKRDVVFSLSNSTPYSNAPALSRLANCWRITGDIRDNWDSMSKKGFGGDKWERFSCPGHWNDPDMLVVGQVGWGKPHPTNLTPDEQYTHITIWCLLSSPLLLGCDLDQLDDFTLNLLTNDEVLAVNQDESGKQARCVINEGDLRVYAKDLADGSKAVGLFNLGETESTVTAPWSELKLSGKCGVRDLWRQKDLGKFDATGFTSLQTIKAIRGNRKSLVAIGKDGLVYVCDRAANRIQVFRKDGTYVTEFAVLKDTIPAATTGSVMLWPDAQQTYILTSDDPNGEFHLLNRADGKYISSFGRVGHNAGEFDNLHNLAIDSKGNIYAAEVGGKRVQKFRNLGGL